MQASLACLLVILYHFGATQGQENSSIPSPQVYFLHVNSDIKFRYARTVISSRIANPASVSQEISFTAVLPETAFISGFTIEVDGKEYNAYVREKEEAKHEYTEAVRSGRTAAHVALSARDSNRFTVSVNVEKQKKVTFKLTYEELLSRKLGAYKHVINLDPGQIVLDLNVQVKIEESTDISTLKVPALRQSNEINEDPESALTNPLATVEHPTPESALIKFSPTPEQQRELASDGIKGQLIVEYDVDRTLQSGEVLVNDGYFVHFFSPVDLQALRKHVTFVLDVSGSMSGRKVEQLRQAMTTILDDLNRNDLFSIVLFSDTAQVWDPALNRTEMKERMDKLSDFHSYYYHAGRQEQIKPQNETLSNSVIVPASLDNVCKAKEFVSHLEALSSTNMYDALMKALEIMELGRELVENFIPSNVPQQQIPEPIIIFLTDGQPNRENYVILKDVTKRNVDKYSIFTLALGNDADLSFLKKLSLRNSGFARKIYEASDTALQLRDFYREVASPLLSNITFKYQTEEGKPEQITKHEFRRLFLGSELVVAGKLQVDNFTIRVEGNSSSGRTTYSFLPTICPIPPFWGEPEAANRSVSAMERLWAYLTIQQLLEDEEAKDSTNEEKNQTSSAKQHALQLALQYSFVTPLTSLVVVKPNETRSVGTQDASLPENHPNHGSWSGPIAAAPPMMAFPRLSYGYAANAPSAFIARPAAMYSPLRQQSVPQGPGALPLLGAPGQRPLPGLGGIPPPGMAGPISVQVMPLPGIPAMSPPPVGAYAGLGAPQQSGAAVPGPFPAPISLIPLNQISWLQTVLNNNTVTLNFGLNGSALHLQVAGDDQPNTPFQICGSPAGIGQCRHLRYCALDSFASNLPEYQNYFCRIQDYAGVCCPNHIGSASSMPGILTPNRVQQNIVTALVALRNITWLPDNSTLRLPSGFAGADEDLQLAAEGEPNLTYGTCLSAAGLGFCRHLRHCAMDVFLNSKSEFYPHYFCKIHGNFVGVCCPLSLQW